MSINLFTDGSVSPKTRIGFGAYMAFSEELENIEDLSENIKVKKFENTSSSKLELQTLLWALSEVSETNQSDSKESKRCHQFRLGMPIRSAHAGPVPQILLLPR